MDVEHNSALKLRDAPIEVLIFDPLSTRPARMLSRHIGPLPLTMAALVVRLLGAGALVLGAQDHKWLIIASLSMLLGFILDATDGKVARLRGDQVHMHGALDFVLDQAAYGAFMASAVWVSWHAEAPGALIALMGFNAAYLALLAVGATRLRLVAEMGIDWRSPGAAASSTRAAGHPSMIVQRMKIVYSRYSTRGRMLLRPTSIEALVVVMVLAPLAVFAPWMVWLAGALLLPDLVLTVGSLVIVATARDRGRT